MLVHEHACVLLLLLLQLLLLTSCLTASLLSFAVNVFSSGSTSLSSWLRTAVAPPAAGQGTAALDVCPHAVGER